MLRRDGTAFHAPTQTVLVADLHLGKAFAFQKGGAAVPEGSTQECLGMLERSVIGASQLIILGDLWHAASNQSDPTNQLLRAWREAHAELNVVLVPGNHDRRFAQNLAGLGIELWPEGTAWESFRIYHHPPHDHEEPSLAGHLHPAVSLEGRKVKCFWRRGQRLVLPAYGPFTGGASIRFCEDDEAFVTVGSSVRALPNALLV